MTCSMGPYCEFIRAPALTFALSRILTAFGWRSIEVLQCVECECVHHRFRIPDCCLMPTHVLLLVMGGVMCEWLLEYLRFKWSETECDLSLCVCQCVVVVVVVGGVVRYCRGRAARVLLSLE